MLHCEASGRAMRRYRLTLGWVAAALALPGCGDTVSEPAASEPGGAGGVTIELPELKAPPPETPVPEQPKEASERKPAEGKKAPTPPPESAPFPLPGAVVARTIERIGYPCGAVASSASVEAPAGERAYRITCTSGRSYRASDRSGRFRFREWSDSER
jgi:hypothetical protein